MTISYNINGDFEKGDIQWPVKGTGFSIVKDPANARTGSFVATRTSGSLSTMGTNLIACRENDDVSAQAFIKCVGNSGNGQVRLTFQDGNNTVLLVLDGNLINHTDYVPSLATVKAPAGSRLFRVELVGSNATGSIYYDDVTLLLANESRDAETSAVSPQLGDPQALGRSRVATQYTDSPRFLAWLEALLEPALNLKDALFQVGDISNIDTAQGVNLDVIGEIVGVSRIIPNSIALVFFGFEFQTASTPFGEEGLLSYGARFREEEESDLASSVLADPEYRTVIKAKILRNHSRGTPEDILEGLVFLIDSEFTQIEDSGGMEIGVVFGRELTTVEISLIDELDILPRPAGVKIKRRITFIPDNYFGFQGQPNAKTFGEETDPSVGGLFAEEI